jgi:hypothetical protein
MTKLDFDFNGDALNWVVFTNNPVYLQNLVDTGFEYNNRQNPPKIVCLGKIIDYVYAYRLDIKYKAVRKYILTVGKRQKRNIVVFPEFVGNSNDQYKSKFTQVIGNWAW